MRTENPTADTTIHLRAREADRALIDSVANLAGVSRSQFLISAGLKEAKNYLLDQSGIYADAEAFNAILDWMDNPASTEEQAGIKRLMGKEPFDERG